jgi:hypothetical protein
MTRKKKFLRWLRVQVKVLPAETYTAYPRTMIYAEEKNLKLPPVLDQHEEEYPVNHFRRCKRLFKKYGWVEVSKYFLKRGFKMIDKNKKEENVETTDNS